MLVIVNDYIIVQKVFALNYTVIELDYELEVFHDLGELQKSVLFDSIRHIHGVQLVVLQFLNDSIDFVWLRRDPVIALLIVLVLLCGFGDDVDSFDGECLIFLLT